MVLEAEHLCMSLRGVQKLGAKTITSSLHGRVRDDARTRREFLSLTNEGPHEPDRTFVIAGASLAGATAAETLRAEGFDGRLVLDRRRDRAALRAPAALQGLPARRGRARLPLRPADGFYAEQEIDLRLGTTVAGLDVAAAEVELAGGERVGYDRLLIATGAEPRRLDVPGGDLDGVHYVREAWRLRRAAEALVQASSVVVVGSGWIGAEVAASARTMGRDVTVIDPPRCRSSGCWGLTSAPSTATSTPTTECGCSWARGWRRSRAAIAWSAW